MKKVIRVKRISSKQLEQLENLGYTVMIVSNFQEDMMGTLIVLYFLAFLVGGVTGMGYVAVAYGVFWLFATFMGADTHKW